MIEDLPDIQDAEYLISNIVSSLKLDENSLLLHALKNSYISCKEVKKGQTWNENGVFLKYVQFSFLVDENCEAVITDSIPDILKGSKSLLHYHGYRHVQWEPLVNVRPIEVDEHLYRNSDFISYSGCYYRSKSEVKVAKAFEKLGVTFIANGRGRFNSDGVQKTLEPDFIVFHEGKCAVLEVDGEAFHDDFKYEKDRDNTLMQNGFLFVEHYPASLCYNDPLSVAESFVSKMENFK